MFILDDEENNLITVVMGHDLAAVGTVSRPGEFFCFPKETV